MVKSIEDGHFLHELGLPRAFRPEVTRCCFLFVVLQVVVLDDLDIFLNLLLLFADVQLYILGEDLNSVLRKPVFLAEFVRQL